MLLYQWCTVTQTLKKKRTWGMSNGYRHICSHRKATASERFDRVYIQAWHAIFNWVKPKWFFFFLKLLASPFDTQVCQTLLNNFQRWRMRRNSQPYHHTVIFANNTQYPDTWEFHKAEAATSTQNVPLCCGHALHWMINSSLLYLVYYNLCKLHWIPSACINEKKWTQNEQNEPFAYIMH